jgi:hypothetical protein
VRGYVVGHLSTNFEERYRMNQIKLPIAMIAIDVDENNEPVFDNHVAEKCETWSEVKEFIQEVYVIGEFDRLDALTLDADGKPHLWICGGCVIGQLRKRGYSLLPRITPRHNH